MLELAVRCRQRTSDQLFREVNWGNVSILDYDSNLTLPGQSGTKYGDLKNATG